MHCDCNSFFASVESVLEPEYKKVPMAVCGSREDRHGIVLAKNELAKAYGIQTAETIASALKKCPDLVIVPPHYEAYKEYSKKANEIYSRYTDIIEPFGIDESWLDVTASRKAFGDGEQIAKKISDSIKKELGITVSIGVSFNKVFAKLGSDYKKPDAITVIDKNNFKKIVYPLPVSALLFVGRKTADVLYSMGIKTIGDLAASSPSMLSFKLGKNGEQLYKYATGLDDTSVSAISEDAKSISNGFTFKHDLLGVEEWKMGVSYLCDEIGTRLRKKNLKCGTVQVTIRDEFFRTIQRQRPQTPASDISDEIACTALDIIKNEWSVNKPIRMITVSASNLIENSKLKEQVSFFDSDFEKNREKKKDTEIAIDKIRRRFGEEAIIKGAFVENDLGIYQHEEKKD